MPLKLLFDIVNCKNFKSLISKPNPNNGCNKIVDFQKKQGITAINDFHVPEPWSGDIVNAPILVVSSNPSFNKDELYPTYSWPPKMIADFFINRFKPRHNL
jgi:hypothetical protein